MTLESGPYLQCMKLKIDGTRDEIMSLKPEFAKSGDNIYCYDEIREAVEEMEVSAGTGSTGYILLSQPSNGTKHDFILGIAFISLSFTMLFAYRKWGYK